MSLVILSSCATSGFQAGELKSSLPVTAKTAMAEVHSIAVPPFYGDTVKWREFTQETLASAGPRLSLIPLQKVDAAADQVKLQGAAPEGRGDLLQKLGRQLQADAVVNGIVFWKERPEIVIQVIASKDGRVLFWQAADFTMKDGPSAQGQRELLGRILGQVKDLAGTREKQVQAPAHSPAAETRPVVEQRREAEPQPKAEQPQKSERRQRPEKKRGPKQQPPADDDVSPM